MIAEGKKPVIFVLGTFQSYTSIIARLIINAGARCPTLIKDTGMGYDVYEDEYTGEFMKKKNKYIIYPTIRQYSNFVNNQPKDMPIVIKYPLTCFFISKIIQKINRPVKLIYVMRNPSSCIQSKMSKSSRDFNSEFKRYCYSYDFMASNDSDIHIVVAERILLKNTNEIRKLLEYCGLKKDVDLDFIDSNKYKKINYAEYRKNIFCLNRK